MIYKVALCGLTVRDERLIEIVISRAPDPKYRFSVGATAVVGDAHIAVADAASVQAKTQIHELRVLNPALVVIYLSDQGLAGDSRYRIERRSLLLRINRMLDEVVERELIGSPVSNFAAGRGAVTRPGPEHAFVTAALESAPVPLQPIRALVVDDSLTVREQLCSALSNAGILSDQADSAENATLQLGVNTYDLVFLDVMMNGADGYSVCRNIKKSSYTRSVPVIMLTSRSSPFDRARGVLAGCDSYLVKPITWEIFFTAIDRVLVKHSRNDRTLLSARGYREAQLR